MNNAIVKTLVLGLLVSCAPRQESAFSVKEVVHPIGDYALKVKKTADNRHLCISGIEDSHTEGLLIYTSSLSLSGEGFYWVQPSDDFICSLKYLKQNLDQAYPISFGAKSQTGVRKIHSAESLPAKEMGSITTIKGKGKGDEIVMCVDKCQTDISLAGVLTPVWSSE